MANEITNAFAAAFQDGPSSQPTQVDKAIARAIGPVIDAKISEIDVDIEAAAAGLVRAETWAALAAIVGTREGQPAETPSTASGTHTDPVAGGTVANGGSFRWSTSPAGWRRVGDAVDAATVTTVNAVVSPSAIYFGTSPILYDFSGAYGQARTIYLNRSFFARTLAGDTTITIGTDSTRIPGYTELQVPNTTTLYKIIINRTTGAVTAVAQSSLPALSTSDVYLFNVRGRVVSQENYPVENVESSSGQLYAYEAFVIEQDRTILCPRVAWNSGYFSSTRPAPSVMFETEVAAIAPGATAQVLYFDQIAAAKGESPFKVASSPVAPDSITAYPLIACASSSSPYSNPKGIPLIGAVPGGSVPNQSNIGKNGVELSTVRYRTTADCDITNADLIALGFTRGVNDPTYQTPYYGGALEVTTAGTFLHARFYVQTDADNSFPTMQIRFLDPFGATVGTVTANIERQIGLRAAAYFIRAAIPAGAVSFYFGTIAATGRDIRLCGGQWHSGARTKLWIMRNDYGVAGDQTDGIDKAILLTGDKSDGKIILPSELFLIEGRQQKIYGDQIMETRTDGQDTFLTLDAGSMLTGNEWPLPVSDKRALTIEGGKVAGLSSLVVRTISQVSRDTRYVRDFTVRTALSSALTGKNVTALFIGDSLTEYTGFPQAAGRELTKKGVNVTFVGTVDCQELDQATGSANLIKAEGRGSRDFRNYTYEDGTGAAVPCEPFPNSFISSYLALSTSGKKEYNPFLRAAIGGDPAQRVFNGQIFDPEFYRTRPWGFTIPVPNFAVINLGTNDIAHGGLPAKSAAVTRGLETIVGQIRDKWPTTYVGLVVNPLPRTDAGDGRWAQQVILYKLFAEYVATRSSDVDGSGRPYVSIIPAFAHASSDVGYVQTVGTTDALTGRKAVTMTDPLHYRGSVKEQVGRAVGSWIGCRVTGA